MYTHTTDPSSPLNLTITNKTSTSLTVEWSPPLTPNGVILSYQVSYVGLESVNPVPDSFETNSTLNTNGTTQTVEVAGLSPYSWYSLSMKAFTSAGGGEETTVTLRTEEDGTSATYILKFKLRCAYCKSNLSEFFYISFEGVRVWILICINIICFLFKQFLRLL